MSSKGHTYHVKQTVSQFVRECRIHNLLHFSTLVRCTNTKVFNILDRVILRFTKSLKYLCFHIDNQLHTHKEPF